MTGYPLRGTSPLARLMICAGLLSAAPLYAQSKCARLEFLAAGHVARLQTRCAADAAATTSPVDPACLATAAERLRRKWDRATAHGDCPSMTSATEAQAIIDALLASLAGALHTAQRCCDTGTMCFAGPSIDAAGCQGELSGTLGAPGSVCDGATGDCVVPPGSGGPCCELASLSLCTAGPGIDPADCLAAGGLDHPASVCEANGACVAP